MKKLVIIIAIFFGVVPVIDKHGEIHLTCTSVSGQVYEEEGEMCGTSNCDEGGFCEDFPNACYDPNSEDPYGSGNTGGDDDGYTDPCDTWPDLCDNSWPGEETDWENDPDWYTNYYDEDWENWFYSGEYTPPPATSILPYITVGSDPKKYFNNSKITLIQSGTNVNLNVADQNGVVTSGFYWEKNTVATCSNTSVCAHDISTAGTYNIRVRGSGNNILIDVELVIVNEPIMVKFHRTPGQQFYGFDEEGMQFSALSSDYSTATIGSQTVQVPWMSLPDGHSDNVSLEILSNSAVASSPSSYSVEFSATNANIQINNSTSPYTVNGSNLGSLSSINVTLNELDPDIYTFKKESILVKNGSGNLIGKLDVSSQKPIVKKLVVVYVNIGDGYKTSVNKGSLLTYLNSGAGYSQIFKKWELESTTTYPDMLDLSTEYANNSSQFLGENPVSVLNYYYNLKKGINVDAVNSSGGNPLAGANPNRVYFLFVTKIPNSNKAGITRDFGHPCAMLYLGGSYGSAMHELGHELNLRHTHESSSMPFGPGIPEASTRNHMDYSINREMFFFYQWPKSF
jgi:hypothetical protein